MNGKDLVAAFYTEGYNNKNYTGVLQYLDPNFTDHGRQTLNAGEAVMSIKLINNAFPDISVQINSLFEEGEMVAFLGTFSGTQLGAYRDVQPTGRHVTFEVIRIFRIREGRLIEAWGNWPEAQIVDQLLPVK